jgi:hypothetical protein
VLHTQAHTRAFIYWYVCCVCLCVSVCVCVCLGRGASAGTGAATSIKDVMDKQASTQSPHIVGLFCPYSRSLLTPVLSAQEAERAAKLAAKAALPKRQLFLY